MKIGDEVTTFDPRQGAPAKGTIRWVSPTKKSFTVVLADGRIVYDFPKEVNPVEAAFDFMGAPTDAFMEVSEP